MNHKRLTILLPLKDREIYTERWLEANVFDDYNYIVADGSLGNGNERIFENIHQDNITYIRFLPDNTITDYVRKMNDAFSKVNTPYVMTADNDDFLLKKGTDLLLESLINDESLIGVQGNIGNTFEIKPDKFTKPVFTSSFDHLNEVSGLSGIEKCVESYNYFWYSIYKTEIYRKIFNIFSEIKADNIYLIELFQTLYSMSLGKVKCLDYPYYVRHSNPVSSRSRDDAENLKYKNTSLGFVLNQEFLDEFSACCSKLAEMLDENDALVFTLVRRRFVIGLIKEKTSSSITKKQFFNYLISIPNIVFNRIVRRSRLVSVIDIREDKY